MADKQQVHVVALIHGCYTETGQIRIVNDGRAACAEATSDARKDGYCILATDLIGWGRATHVIEICPDGPDCGYAETHDYALARFGA